MSTLTLLLDGNNADCERVEAFWASTGEIVRGHEECVAFMGNIQGFPSVVCTDGQGDKRALYNPASLEEVLAWQHSIDNPPVVQKQSWTQEELTSAFTYPEKGKIQQYASDPSKPMSDVVAGFLWDVAHRQSFDRAALLADFPILVQLGLLTQDRMNAILGIS